VNRRRYDDVLFCVCAQERYMEFELPRAADCRERPLPAIAAFGRALRGFARSGLQPRGL
jgi:hypothetical protein